MRKFTKGVVGKTISWSEVRVGERTTMVAQRTLPDKNWYVYWLSPGKARTLSFHKTRAAAERFITQYLKAGGY